MIIQNAVKIKEGDKVTFLKSSFTHDFNSYKFKNGKYFAVDGGRDYLRRAYDLKTMRGHRYSVRDFSLNDKSSPRQIRERLLWGTYGIRGDQPLQYKPLSQCSTAHLQAILRTQVNINPIHKTTIEAILKLRKKKS